MLKSLIMLVAASALALTECATDAGGTSAQTVIINATIVSPEREAPLKGAWVAITDGRISALGQGRPPHAEHIIDAAGKYLIPGLIDSHVHLYHATGLKRQYTDNYKALYAAYMEQQPRSFLYFGFTTVIELNADFETNARFLSAPLRPRLFHCGQGVILSDGFMALELEPNAIEKEYPGYLIDSYRDASWPDGADPLQHTPEAAVAYVKSRAGKCVKAYYEEALWWPEDKPPAFSLPTVAILRDLAAAAHAQQMPLILHATTPDGDRVALDANVDILAHGMWEWPGQAFDAQTPKTEYQTLADEVAQSDLWLQPTFQTIRNTASMFDNAVLADARWGDAVPAAYLAYLNGDAQKQREIFLSIFGKRLAESGGGKPVSTLQRAFFRRYQSLIGGMAAKGANLLFGSDTAVGGFGWASPPGLAGLWEIEAWREAGIDRRTIFRALTMNNAKTFGLLDDLGTIEKGKYADLLLLKLNPLDDVAAYDSIDLVIANGDVVDRAALSARGGGIAP
ncbi:MAG: amidohydrolase family protein [Parvularculaceae bacterium]